MPRFEYLTTCPECSKVGLESHLGFDSDTDKITCDGVRGHEFDQMPGELAPVLEDPKLPEPNEFHSGQGGDQSTFTPEEEAALDAAMARAPRRDFGGMVSDPEPENMATAVPEAQQPPIPEMPPLMTLPVSDAASPRVGLGGFVGLAGGDVLCGVRVSETWVSALAAEGENQSPPKNVAEYLQEILDLGLLEWHSITPAPR